MQNIIYAAIFRQARNLTVKMVILQLAIICASWIFFQLRGFPILTWLDICTPK